MANENQEKSAPVAAKQTVKTGGKTSGLIVHNTRLDAWQCYDANRSMVLSTGSKDAAVAAYPNFAVKE